MKQSNFNKLDILQIFESKPKGIIPQLNYFRDQRIRLKQKGVGAEYIKLIDSEIELLSEKIRAYEEPVIEQGKSIEKCKEQVSKMLNDANTTNRNFKEVELIKAISPIFFLSGSITLALHGNYIASIFFLFLSASIGFFFRDEISNVLRLLSSTRRLVKIINQLKVIAKENDQLSSHYNLAKATTKPTQKAPGLHSEKVDEIVKLFLEVEKNNPGISENKHYNIFSKEYQAKYDLRPPGKTTVLRYLGRTY